MSALDLNNLGFDPDALHKKYLEERDKRLRADGLGQYLDLSGEYAEYSHDPYVEPGFTRPAQKEEVDVVVLGGGFAGLISAARLREHGVKSMRLIEAGGDFGGTWYWNRYPGIRCDIESYIYIPLLEEVGTMPTEKYAEGEEIFRHCQAAGRHFDLYKDSLFQTEVKSIIWDDAEARWIVKTDRDDVLKARFVIAGSGPLHRPKFPGIKGIRDFKGVSFHTSRWNYDFTGGSSSGGLVKLKDKRVAIIGTGATTIQVLPHVGEWAKKTYLFQRTPSAVDIRGNKPTDKDWFKSLEPGWQKKRRDNFVSIMLGMPQEVDMVSDRWTDVWGKLATWSSDQNNAGDDAADPEFLLQIADYQKMEEIRARVDSIVEDPKTAESLKPWYNLFCKRPLYSDDFLQSFNLPGVELVDTQGRGVDLIDETGLWFDGVHYEVDCIVYATGFQVGANTYQAGGYELVGRNGCKLSEKWDKGVRSLYGIVTNEFPNFFIVGQLAQASVTVNYPHTAERQADFCADIVAQALEAGVRTLELTEEAEKGWAELMAAKAFDRAKFETECTPGYFNNEGNIKDKPSVFGGTFGGGPFEYAALLEEWRAGRWKQDSHITYQEK